MRDLTGLKADRLSIQACVGKTKWGTPLWRCICICGKEVIIESSNLTRNLDGKKPQSCGCYRDDLIVKRHTTHGETLNGRDTKEHMAWSSMLKRCRNPNTKNYHLYGGVGVKVCKRWMRFENFLQDVGRAPSKKHSLDRWPNNNGNYEPGNVRWATSKEQLNNLRTNVLITAFGKTQTQQQWSDETGIARDTLAWRIKSGRKPEEALTSPVLKTYPKGLKRGTKK